MPPLPSRTYDCIEITRSFINPEIERNRELNSVRTCRFHVQRSEQHEVSGSLASGRPSAGRSSWFHEPSRRPGKCVDSAGPTCLQRPSRATRHATCQNAIVTCVSRCVLRFVGRTCRRWPSRRTLTRTRRLAKLNGRRSFDLAHPPAFSFFASSRLRRGGTIGRLNACASMVSASSTALSPSGVHSPHRAAQQLDQEHAVVTACCRFVGPFTNRGIACNSARDVNGLAHRRRWRLSAPRCKCAAIHDRQPPATFYAILASRRSTMDGPTTFDDDDRRSTIDDHAHPAIITSAT